jgi:trimeric autotransporter adhesin
MFGFSPHTDREDSMLRIPSLTLGIVGLVLLLGSSQSWAQTGYPALTATENTAYGTDTLTSNIGYNNAAFGFSALYANTVGNYNTATGSEALTSNTGGKSNTANGAGALYFNDGGNGNTASGDQALYGNTNGGSNAAVGLQALYGNTTGGGNTALGAKAGAANTRGTDNTFIGFLAGTSAGTFTNGTALGYGATLRASNSIVLGNSSITKIYAHVTSITAISDRRLKKDIVPLAADLGLGFIEKLKPVAYRFNNGDETQRYGFIAQDLEQALPAKLHDMVEKSQPDHGLALIERQNDQARTYRVAYGELTAPMVKAIQQQQQEIAGLRQALSDRDAHVAALEGRLAHLEAAMARLAQGKPVRETEAVAPPGHRRSAASSTAMAAKGWEN